MNRTARWLTSLLLAALLLGAAACSTVEGFGKDIKKLGETIEDSAK